MKQYSIYLFTMILLFISNCVAAQDKNLKGDTTTIDVTKKALTENVITPSVILGPIGENPTINNLTLSLIEKKVSLQGILFANSKNFVSTVKIEGEDENKTVGLFSGKNLNSKFSGNLSATYMMRPWVRNYLFDKHKVLKDLNGKTYSDLIKPKYYNLVRHRFDYVTIGLIGTGAQYNLFDSTANFGDMVSKQKFNGWQVYAQYNRVNYNPRMSRATIHAVKVTYGEVNNIDDLEEYSFTKVQSYVAGNSARNAGQSITGYFDDYFVQHQAVLSYEYNVYPMDSTLTKLGYVFGVDFIYNQNKPNLTRFNVGLNLPVIYGKTNDDKDKHIYIAAILSSVDPLNFNNVVDFKLKDSFAVTLKLATNLNLNFRD